HMYPSAGLKAIASNTFSPVRAPPSDSHSDPPLVVYEPVETCTVPTGFSACAKNLGTVQSNAVDSGTSSAVACAAPPKLASTPVKLSASVATAAVAARARFHRGLRD